jgi:hypothetical protein
MGPSKFYPADFCALHSDTTSLIPPSSSSLFLPERPSLDRYCITGMNNITSSLFNLNHNPYRYYPGPPPTPLTLPVKFVVPPRTDGVLSDTTRICFEDSSANESMNKSINNKHSNKICIDNYSRIILNDDNSRRYVSELFEDVYPNCLSRKLCADSHQSTPSDDKYTNIIASKQPRKHSLEIFKIDDKSKALSNGEHHRRSSSKNILVEQHIADEISTKEQNNIQRILVDPVASNIHHKQSCERKESKSVIAYDLQSNPLKMKSTSPLDLTKLK